MKNALAEPILCIYWHEAGEDTSSWWGQLAGGMHRLMAVREEFGALRRMRDVEKSLRRLELYLEVYLAHAYELEERARGFLASLTRGSESIKKTRDKIRKKEGCDNALARLYLTDPQLSSALEELLRVLDESRDLRNEHTHRHYLSLGIGWESYDPYDALVDVSDQPSELQKLRRRLLRGIRQMSDEYFDRADRLLVLVEKVLYGDSITPRALVRGAVLDTARARD